MTKDHLNKSAPGGIRVQRRRIVRIAAAASVVAASAIAGSSSVASAAPPRPAADSNNPVVLYSSDGMRPDLMQKYAAAGELPTYKSLMKNGVRPLSGPAA